MWVLPSCTSRKSSLPVQEGDLPRGQEEHLLLVQEEDLLVQEEDLLIVQEDNLSRARELFFLGTKNIFLPYKLGYMAAGLHLLTHY